MIMEKRYILINNQVKVSDSKMPELKTYRQTMGSAVYEVRYKRDYGNWLFKLQPCEIDERELANIKLWVNSWETNNPIDITDIVFEKDGKIYFKQPKQVESDADIIKSIKKVLYESAKKTQTENCFEINIQFEEQAKELIKQFNITKL